MFTNEFQMEATVTTVLDESGKHDDVELIISDDYVCLRQWDDDDDWADLIMISHQQWLELLTALKMPEGAYHTRITRTHND